MKQSAKRISAFIKRSRRPRGILSPLWYCRQYPNLSSKSAGVPMKCPECLKLGFASTGRFTVRFERIIRKKHAMPCERTCRRLNATRIASGRNKPQCRPQRLSRALQRRAAKRLPEGCSATKYPPKALDSRRAGEPERTGLELP